jgi:hypothetical protein
VKRLSALLLLLASPAVAQGSAATAVGAFYGVYQQAAHGGVPDATGRLRYGAVLTPGLGKLLADAASAQARIGAKVKAGGPKSAVPPLQLEGDIFTSFFDGATRWKPGPCLGDAKVQRCSVSLSHAAAKPGDKPVNWIDTLVVVNLPAGWKVDDVVYDANFAFGNTGKLSEMLEMVKSQNP